MSNQIQNSNEMQKPKTLNQVQDLVWRDHNLVLNLGLMKIRLVSKSLWKFDIPLKFGF